MSTYSTGCSDGLRFEFWNQDSLHLLGHTGDNVDQSRRLFELVALAYFGSDGVERDGDAFFMSLNELLHDFAAAVEVWGGKRGEKSALAAQQGCGAVELLLLQRRTI